MKVNKVFGCATSLILAFALAFSFPASAYAESVGSEECGANGSALNLLFPQAGLNANTGDKIGSSTTLSNSNEGLSEKFDLRDPNGDGDRSDSLVTNVKEQNPWGTCWGFSSIAASETSILSRAAFEGKTISNLDLSELQLANSVYKNGGALESVVGSAQAGEGYRNETSDPNGHLNGGLQVYASNVFACGIGPVKESDAPYKNSDGVYEYVYIAKGDVSKTKRTITIANAEQLAALKVASEENSVKPVWYAGNYTDATTGSMAYTDWSTSDELWMSSAYEFENSNILPETRKLKTDGEGKTVYDGIDMDAVKAIKSELQFSQRAVTCSYNTDNSNYNHNGWTYYNANYTVQNHGVTIVGWDDTISADSFGGITGNGAKPEGNGAWLIKNSWGADVDQNGNAQSFPNAQDAYDFGIEENGKNTGYFWLSYYDRTITTFESFDFDLQTTELSDDTIQDQYDYLPAGQYPTISTTEKSSTANVFTASSDMSLRTIGLTTFVANTAATVEIYLLDGEATSPTDVNHSKLVGTYEGTFDYAGYHRMTFSEENWVAMRKGQRYALVVSQKCNTDGKWYQGVAIQQGKPTADMLTYYKYSSAVPAQVNNHANTEGAALIRRYMEEQGMDQQTALKKVREEMAAKYDPIDKYYVEISTSIAAGKSEAEAKSAAKAKYPSIDFDECTSIEADSEAAVTAYSQVYWVAKVNAGESYITTNSLSDWQKKATSILSSADSAKTASTDWTDWTAVSNTINANTGVVCDNMPIKGYSQTKSWATVAELTALQNAINNAKVALVNDSVSENGTDVYADKMWMTQAQKDALNAAIPSAESVLALAGSDFANTLINTTPTSDEVNAAIQTLQYLDSNGTMSALSPTSTILADTGDAMSDVALFFMLLFVSSIILGAIAFKKREL